MTELVQHQNLHNGQILFKVEVLQKFFGYGMQKTVKCIPVLGVKTVGIRKKWIPILSVTITLVCRLPCH